MIDSLKEYTHKKKARNILIIALALVVLVFLGYKVEFDLIKILKGIPSMMDLFKRMLRLNPDYVGEVSLKLLETIEIAVISSLMGIFISMPLSIFISRNIAPNKVVWRLLNWIFALFRTIPSLVWAALLVSVFSIGKFSGILALGITATLASLKLLKDNIEAIPDNVLNSAEAVGASKFQVLKYCVFPTILEQSLAVFFMVLEINIRGATVLGLVGAGGIGQIMWRDLNHLRYDNLATLILILLITIFLIDFVSLKVRQGFKTRSKVFKDLESYKRYKKLKNIFIVGLIIILLLAAYRAVGINRERLLLGLEQGRLIVARMVKLDWSYKDKLFVGLKESLYIALFSTVIGGFTAWILTYFASYNLCSNKYIVGLVKGLINLLRTFPSIVTAIIFFRGVGPGPLAGVMALSIYTTGVLTKLYSEVIESMNPNILNSVRVTGASNFAIYRYGVIPQTMPNFVSLVLYRLESNMRTSTILGIIGAGGVGTSLTMNITWRNWEKVGLLIFGIAVSVAIIDLISNGIRKKYI